MAKAKNSTSTNVADGSTKNGGPGGRVQNRFQLPILEWMPPHDTPMVTTEAEQPTVSEFLRPPKGAPNVLIVLIDDMGFGASSAHCAIEVSVLTIDGRGKRDTVRHCGITKMNKKQREEQR